MAGAAPSRNLYSAGEYSDHPPLNFSDMVFGFLDENYPLSENSNSDNLLEERGLLDDDDEEENLNSPEDKKAFWDEQETILQGILCRTTSVETRIRQATKESLRISKTLNEGHCSCRRKAEAVAGGCLSCVRREIYEHLCKAGFNCSIRTSQWKSSPQIPSGEHTYLEVSEKSASKKGETRVVIELNFRAEFEVARASLEYNRLIEKLPEVYVGKPERLRNLVKILCGAAKKCMKENKMHMGPWRKHQYMQAKWLSACAAIGAPIMSVEECSGQRLAKPRASMLTLSLQFDKLSGSSRHAVAVV